MGGNHLAIPDLKSFPMKPPLSNRAESNATGCISKSGRLSRTEDKVVPGLSITGDITELKQAEETARESERFARSIFDALSEHICILDESGTIIAINRAWREFDKANPLMPRHTAEEANYLALCDAVTGSDALEAHAFAAGRPGLELG